MRRRNVVSLVAGLALVALGLAVVLDDAGELNLEFAFAGPALLAAAGALLLASGLAGRRGRAPEAPGGSAAAGPGGSAAAGPGGSAD